MPDKGRKPQVQNKQRTGFHPSPEQKRNAAASNIKNLNKNAPEQRQSRSQTRGPRAVGLERARDVIQRQVPRLHQLEVGKLLGQYLDPANYAPVRLPDISSATTLGTAVCTLFVADTLEWTSTTPSLQDLPFVNTDSMGGSPIVDDANHRLVVNFRDPVCMGIVLQGPFDTALASEYDSVVNFPGNGLANRTLELDSFLPFAEFRYQNGPQRHGLALLNGLVAGGDEQVVWIDASGPCPANIQINLTFQGGFGADFEATFELVLWTDEHSSRVAASVNQNVNGGNNSFGTQFNNIQTSGYYSIRLHISQIMAGFVPPFWDTASIAIFMRTALSCHHVVHPSVSAASHGKQGQELIGSARVLGNTMLVSNSTADMFKSGTVYTRQVDGNVAWYDGCAATADYTTSNLAASYDGPLSKGLYAVVKPQGEKCMDLLDFIDSNEDGAACLRTAFRPFQTGGTVVALLCPGAPTLNSPNTSLVVHWFRGFEFTTTSQLFAVGTASISRVDMLNFMDELAHVQQFYENPLHLRDIAAAIRRAAQWAWANRSTLTEVAKLVGRAATMVAATI